MKLRTALLGLGAAAALSLASPKADAAFLINFDGINTESTATANYLFLDENGNVGLDLTLTNTTDPSYGSQITGFGFDLPDGQFVSVQFSDTNGWTLAPNTFLGGAIGSFDLCIQNDSNNSCTGNDGNGGITPGASLTFGFTFDTTLNAASLEQAFLTTYTGADTITSTVRFQSVGPNGQLSDVGPNGPPTTVPEPASMALFGLGLLGLGAVARRRARRQANAI